MAKVKYPLTLEIEMVSCNNDCAHCYAGGGGRKYLRTLNDLKRIHHAFSAALPGKVIVDLGYLIHEITLHPDLIDILKWLKSIDDTGKYNSHLITNGSVISNNRKKLDELIGLGIKSLQLTVFGIGDTHDDYAGRRGAFDDVISASRTGAIKGLMVTWNIHMHRGMRGQIPEIERIAADIGILKQDMRWVVSSPIGRATGLQERRLTIEDIEGHPGKISELRKSGIRSEAEIVSTTMSGRKNQPAEEGGDVALPEPEFVVTQNDDVHLYFEGYDDYSFLGSLRHHGVEEIIRRYENEESPCMKVESLVTDSQLASRFGDPTGTKMYYEGNLLGFWRRLYWEQHIR